jgi:peroxiredoxin
MLKEGEQLPNFRLPLYPAGEFAPEAQLGQRYVLFVYPKDDTYG